MARARGLIKLLRRADGTDARPSRQRERERAVLPQLAHGQLHGDSEGDPLEGLRATVSVGDRLPNMERGAALIREQCQIWKGESGPMAINSAQ
eukprot:1283441-Prymnesium_polylepis.1